MNGNYSINSELFFELATEEDIVKICLKERMPLEMELSITGMDCRIVALIAGRELTLNLKLK